MKRLISIVALAFVPACSSTPAAPTVVPAAVVQGVGEGSLILHPSADARFVVAIDFPIRLHETAGGSASWNFARLSLLLNGAEIERNELSHDALAGAGIQNVTANSNQLIHILFRSNADDFNGVTLTLGMGDLKDARAFTTDVPFASFGSPLISFTPASRAGVK